MESAETSLSARGAVVGGALGVASGTIEIGLWTIGMLERDVVPPRTAMLLVRQLARFTEKCEAQRQRILLRRVRHFVEETLHDERIRRMRGCTP